MDRPAPRGTVYLLHFHQPLAHARHYVGWTQDIGMRLLAHDAGAGARIMEVVGQAGITWECARIWPNQTRAFERRLHASGKARICPCCREHLETLHARYSGVDFRSHRASRRKEGPDKYIYWHLRTHGR